MSQSWRGVKPSKCLNRIIQTPTRTGTPFFERPRLTRVSPASMGVATKLALLNELDGAPSAAPPLEWSTTLGVKPRRTHAKGGQISRLLARFWHPLFNNGNGRSWFSRQGPQGKRRVSNNNVAGSCFIALKEGLVRCCCSTCCSAFLTHSHSRKSSMLGVPMGATALSRHEETCLEMREVHVLRGTTLKNSFRHSDLSDESNLPPVSVFDVAWAKILIYENSRIFRVQHLCCTI